MGDGWVSKVLLTQVQGPKSDLPECTEKRCAWWHRLIISMLGRQRQVAPRGSLAASLAHSLISESEIHGYPEEQHSELIPDFHTCVHTHTFVHLYTHKHVYVGTYTEEERRGGGREGGRKGESVSGH